MPPLHIYQLELHVADSLDLRDTKIIVVRKYELMFCQVVYHPDRFPVIVPFPQNRDILPFPADFFQSCIFRTENLAIVVMYTGIDAHGQRQDYRDGQYGGKQFPTVQIQFHKCLRFQP